MWLHFSFDALNLNIKWSPWQGDSHHLFNVSTYITSTRLIWYATLLPMDYNDGRHDSSLNDIDRPLVAWCSTGHKHYQGHECDTFYLDAIKTGFNILLTTEAFTDFSFFGWCISEHLEDMFASVTAVLASLWTEKSVHNVSAYFNTFGWITRELWCTCPGTG